ncbi:unnamed protein product [Somion occarium]|uniref:BAG domain-containing protein n=1 Tax=Somion occarium TaxID=3059160 RepID=A0ABP1CRI1_9APHY
MPCIPPLAYTPTNAPLHHYYEELNRLLTALDAVESHGDKTVREQRRELARKVEREAERIQRWKVAVWKGWEAKTGDTQKVADQSDETRPICESQDDVTSTEPPELAPLEDSMVVDSIDDKAKLDSYRELETMDVETSPPPAVETPSTTTSESKPTAEVNVGPPAFGEVPVVDEHTNPMEAAPVPPSTAETFNVSVVEAGSKTSTKSVEVGSTMDIDVASASNEPSPLVITTASGDHPPESIQTESTQDSTADSSTLAQPGDSGFSVKVISPEDSSSEIPEAPSPVDSVPTAIHDDEASHSDSESILFTPEDRTIELPKVPDGVSVGKIDLAELRRNAPSPLIDRDWRMLNEFVMF